MGPDTTAVDAAAAAAARQAATVAAAGSITLPFLLDRVAVLADDAFEGRDSGSPGGAAARGWLVADLQKLGLAPLASTGYELPFVGGVNLCARVPGADPTVVAGATPTLAEEVVVVGAHYDHLGHADHPGSQCKAAKGAADRICNGAIDNAAGVAAAIAVARALSQRTLPLRRGVVLCLFDAEEDGLLGAKAFVAAAQSAAAAGGVGLGRIVAMVSIDNVGSAPIPGEMSSFATDAEFSDGLRAAVHAANAVSGYQVWPVSSFFVGQEGGGRSDHLPFREAGVPVLFLGSGSDPVYHTTADEVGAVVGAKLLGIARHAAVLVASIADADGRPDLVSAPLPHLDDARALVALAQRVLDPTNPLGLSAVQRGFVQGVQSELQGWLAAPPQTEAEWDAYQSFVKSVISAVFAFGQKLPGG